MCFLSGGEAATCDNNIDLAFQSLEQKQVKYNTNFNIKVQKPLMNSCNGNYNKLRE